MEHTEHCEKREQFGDGECECGAAVSESALNDLLCSGLPEIVYENGMPKGIRDNGGYLLFFTHVDKYQGQDDRYKCDVEHQHKLAKYLLNALLAT